MSKWLYILGIALVASVAGAQRPQEIPTEGLAHPAMVRDIYLGRFELLHEASVDEFGDGWTDALKTARLNLAFLTHHGAWDSLCGDGSKEPMKVHVTSTYRDGKKVDGSERKVRVRERFSATYTSLDHPGALAFDLMKGSVSDGRMDWGKLTRIIGDVTADSRRIISSTGCSSVMLAQFEDNLNRAVTNEKPVQNSRSWPEREPVFMKGCGGVVKEMTGRQSAAASQCECMHRTLIEAVGPESVYRLEDSFDRRAFLLLAASKTGLAERLSRCFAKESAK